MEEFKTIAENSETEIEEKKSKFIANIFYVENIEEAERQIKNIKKKHFSARHHCYAYRIYETSGLKEKQSDDGEPTGTAGIPILNTLQKNELANILVVVTRYFGGILLGTGGLVRAYSDASANVIKKSKIVWQQMGYLLKICIEYKDFEKFKYYCRKNEIYIKDIVYEKNINCIIELTKEEKAKLLEKNQKEIMILDNIVLEEKYIKTNKKT